MGSAAECAGRDAKSPETTGIHQNCSTTNDAVLLGRDRAQFLE
jgi:hypothetical protein